MKKILKIVGFAIANLLMIAMIVMLLLVNWWPAIYSSDWFKAWYPR